ncbi:AmmeMemoRadiSam system protein B [Candidatus Zixiibacteriota bacterium]
MQSDERVMPCSGAGTWFPEDPVELQNMVNRFLAVEALAIPEAPVALIVPHAGYAWSGEVAGHAFTTLKDHTYRRVILMGLSHRVPLKGASVLNVDAWETPLGRIPVDEELRDALLKHGSVSEIPGAHSEEHSTGNQLPLLQRALGDFRLVEMVVGEMTDSQRARLAGAIRDLIDEETLLVISTDFTHFGTSFMYRPFDEDIPANLKALNDLAVQQILEVDVPGWDAYLEQTRDTICGRNAVGLLLEILQPWRDARGLRVAYDTSGNRSGDWSTSVTYASIVFWRERTGLTEEEQQTLLQIARDASSAWLRNGVASEIVEENYELTPRLRAPGAAFVTLRSEKELRGCIGHVVAQVPLYTSVAHNAVQASQDPRFYMDPVTEKELSVISFEVSVLSPMRRLLEPRDVEIGRDGLVMIQGPNQGLLLPQIPTEQGWDRNEFLSHTCLKAGLPPDAWKDSRTEIYHFSAQVFGEEEQH